MNIWTRSHRWWRPLQHSFCGNLCTTTDKSGLRSQMKTFPSGTRGHLNEKEERSRTWKCRLRRGQNGHFALLGWLAVFAGSCLLGFSNTWGVWTGTKAPSFWNLPSDQWYSAFFLWPAWYQGRYLGFLRRCQTKPISSHFNLYIHITHMVHFKEERIMVITSNKWEHKTYKAQESLGTTVL